jgi:transcription factor CP2-like protein
MFRPMEEEFGPTPSKQIKEENVKRGISPFRLATDRASGRQADLL